MSAKDYRKFAEAIRKIEYLSIDQKRRLASDLADIFRRDNSRFDETRFLVACGLPVEV